MHSRAAHADLARDLTNAEAGPIRTQPADSVDEMPTSTRAYLTTWSVFWVDRQRSQTLCQRTLWCGPRYAA